ncbi:Phospho-N-acetylmuramoyl-pentapeptide-transferase-like protein [Hibiscus syriacus]|uniref:Phospho-N-acetylmuramoyl-pentapeptide-transferase-like protein n=1 Tax=Hibiscus syriacus TaxID=106335 RepID=A0A6A2XIC3_HIBSY|nr:Phospho-N-acetylmuramoyl-pentapeptide-transferase-like protein [Hibiscus syriacus]
MYRSEVDKFVPTSLRLTPPMMIKDNDFWLMEGEQIQAGASGDYLNLGDHLFTECSLAVTLWKVILNLTGLSRPPLSWVNMLAWACGAWKGDCSCSTKRLSFCSLVGIDYVAELCQPLWHVFSSSSDGEYSDGEIVLSPLAEVVLPSVSADDSVTMRSLTSRRLPLAPFYLTSPFTISLVLAACAGYICIPYLKTLEFHQIIRKEGPASHSKKQRTPTMGGLFFLPVGIFVGNFVTGFFLLKLLAAAAATLAFATIGMVDDVLCVIKQHSSGLSTHLRLLLEAAVGICFSFWFSATNLPSPYGMKMVVPLSATLGLVCFGKFYLLLTPFCFVSTRNGIKLTDGLAGGTAALALIGMSIAVIPICPELAIFGASMAGACVGFLLHNRYKASVFMGDIGSLALGAALAAMATCTGMSFPLIISSGIFVLEASSVILQVFYFKITKQIHGSGRCLFRMAPFHHHLELSGHKEPVIDAGAYAVSYLLALFAGYVGLVST